MIRHNLVVKACLVICAVLLSVIALKLFLAPGVSAEGMPQYATVEIDWPAAGAVQATLNKYAKDGWTLVAAPVNVHSQGDSIRSLAVLIFVRDQK